MISFLFILSCLNNNSGKKEPDGEEEIKGKIKNGDIEGAFELIMEKYLENIYNCVYFRIIRKEDAEDITQEVFIKVWKNLKKFKFKSSIKTWLYRIAINTIKNENKIMERRAIIEELDQDIVDQNAINPEEKILNEEIGEIIVNFLDKYLCEKEKEILYKRVLEELKWEEISEIVKKKKEALRTKMNRMLETLRNASKKDEEYCNIFKEYLSNKDEEEK